MSVEIFQSLITPEFKSQIIARHRKLNKFRVMYPYSGTAINCEDTYQKAVETARMYCVCSGCYNTPLEIEVFDRGRWMVVETYTLQR